MDFLSRFEKFLNKYWIIILGTLTLFFILDIVLHGSKHASTGGGLIAAACIISITFLLTKET